MWTEVRCAMRYVVPRRVLRIQSSCTALLRRPPRGSAAFYVTFSCNERHRFHREKKLHAKGERTDCVIRCAFVESNYDRYHTMYYTEINFPTQTEHTHSHTSATLAGPARAHISHGRAAQIRVSYYTLVTRGVSASRASSVVASSVRLYLIGLAARTKEGDILDYRLRHTSP